MQFLNPTIPQSHNAVRLPGWSAGDALDKTRPTNEKYCSTRASEGSSIFHSSALHKHPRRLDEAVKYVSKMALEKILDDDDWGSTEVIKEMMSNPVTSLPQSNNCVGADGDAETISSGLLERDFGAFFDDVI